MTRLTECLGLNDRKRLIGFTFITAVAIIWVVASFLVQGLESSGAHPAVLTFIANSLFAIYLPISFVARRHFSKYTAAPLGDGLDYPPAKYLHRSLIVAALIVAPMWYFAQLTFNASLSLTSITSNTILSSTSVLFTFVFSIAVLGELFSLKKLAFVALLIGGTALVASADTRSEGGKQSLAGDVLCLVSSVIYGSYTVAIKRLLRDDDSMSLFFGLMGAIIFFVAGPVLLVLWSAGVHLGAVTRESLGLMVVKGLADNVLSDYLWAKAILLVGPTTATSGLALQIPLAIILDAVFGFPPWLGHFGTAILTFLGAAIILTGFFGINREEGNEETSRRWEAQREGLQVDIDLTNSI